MVNAVEQTYRDLTQQGRPITRLFSGNPVEHGLVFPGEILKQEYEKYFTSMEYKPDPKGDLGARRVIQKYYASQKVTLSPDQILLTSGTSESYLHVLSALCQAGDNILVPHPGYPLFDHIAETVHVELRPYRLMEDFQWAVDMDSLLEKIDGKTRALVLISPHNPTGAVLSEAELREIVDIANERNLAIISDEVFSEFVFDGHEYPRVAQVAKPQLLFTLNGISKMFALPSMKLGWVVVSGDEGKVGPMVDCLETKADTYLACHTAIQKALPAIFEQGQWFLRDYRAEVGRRRQRSLELLQTGQVLALHPPRGGFYLTLKVNREGVDEEDLVIRLMKETGMFVHPGYFYDCGSEAHLVLSFLSPETVLEQALPKLTQFLDRS